MLEYWWMASNGTGWNDSDVVIDDVLQDPGLVTLFVDYPQWLLYFAAACCILFMLLGIPGNLITVVALFRTQKLWNSTAIFIMNLSLSDLMFCCFNLPLATSTFWHRAWLHGSLLCRLFPLLRYGLVAVSLFSVLAITINRYVLIGHPHLYSTLYKTKYLMPMVLAIWIFSFGLLVVTWFERWGRFGLDTAIGSCSILPDVNGHSPKIFLFVLAFLIPCLAIIVCYARIFYIVRKSSLKSRGGNRIVNVELTEINNEQRSSSTRNQEEELSVFCTSPIPMPATYLVSGLEEEVDEDSSCSKQLLDDELQTNCTTTLHVNRATMSNNVRLDSNRSNSYDTFHGSLTITAEDIPFADEPDVSVKAKRFLNKNQSRDKPQRRSSKGYCNQLNRMTSRASFIMESSLWARGVADDDQLNHLETFVGSRSHSPEQSFKRQAIRRESKFRTVVSRIRNGEAVPRMSDKDRKVLQMILVIFLSFLVCYLPITITKLFHDMVDWRGLNITGYILIYLTTCINPIIYVVMSSEYRSAYKYVLLCKCENGNRWWLVR
ncbi:G-protein coupled receptor moody [Harpegnathos saltator]|nr:G-protein coupled receptor moody [Harpegnathos saltator]